MAKKVAKFYKVSYEQYKKDFLDAFGSDEKDENKIDAAVREIYDGIELPKRGTVGSAGYDFFAPFGFSLHPGQTVKIPTGIRCEIKNDWVLKCYPRSGLGFKYRLQLNNTVGIIDSDYFNAKNEGHIMAKITNDTNENKTVDIDTGKGFMQGIFVEYGITKDDEVTEERTGGFGSTDK